MTAVYGLRALGAGVAAALVLSAAAAAAEEALPDDAGREEVEIYCSACHSLKIVVQQRLSRDAWDETLVWMVEEQAMDPLTEDERKLVLDYLAAHFNAKTPR